MSLRYENIGKGDCIIFDKCIYGLVQAMRQSYKKAITTLKKARFNTGNFDPCHKLVEG